MANTINFSLSIIMVLALIGSSFLRACTANKKHNSTSPTKGQGQGSSVPQGQSGWPAGYNFSRGGDCNHKNRTHSRGHTKIVVGGSAGWTFGFNYTDWAFKTGPFYINDVFVFKYAAPVKGGPGHSVYLLPDFWSYLKCDLSKAKRIATTTQGGGKEEFEFKLTKWQPHYFACGEHNGIHCNLGLMKFFVMPLSRYNN